MTSKKYRLGELLANVIIARSYLIIVYIIITIPRYSNDHEMFKEILALLTENFNNTKQDGYVSFATDAISAIYHVSAVMYLAARYQKALALHGGYFGILASESA